MNLKELYKQADYSNRGCLFNNDCIKLMKDMDRLENVSLDVLDRLCRYFNCSLSDIIEHKKDEE